jgi:DNA primase
MHAAGFRNVVATCGTALTSDHLAIFKRLANKVTVLFDGDKAGVAATERAMETGLDQGIVIYGAEMPQGLDPDEILWDSTTQTICESGTQRMVEILKASQPLLDEKINKLLLSALSGPEERVQALKKVGSWLAQFQDPVGREVRAQHIQKKLGIPYALIQEAIGLVKNSKAGSFEKRVQAPLNPLKSSSTSFIEKEKRTKMSSVDKILLGGMILGEEYSRSFADARGHLPPEMTLEDLFEYPPAKDFVAMLLAQPGQLEKLRSAPELLFEADLDIQVRSTLTEGLVVEGGVRLEDFRAAIFKRITRNWARFSQRIKRAIAEAEVKKDTNLHDRLMKEYLDVQRKMKEFSNFYDEE